VLTPGNGGFTLWSCSCSHSTPKHSHKCVLTTATGLSLQEWKGWSGHHGWWCVVVVVVVVVVWTCGGRGGSGDGVGTRYLVAVGLVVVWTYGGEVSGDAGRSPSAVP